MEKCLQHKGVLESNLAIVSTKFLNIETVIKDAWFGCFLINEYTGLKHFTTGHYEMLECQTSCEDNSFFTIQETDCYCMDDITPFEKLSCNCTDCYVWEHNGINLGFLSNKDQMPSKECQKHGSFIKWYPDNFCLSNTLQHQFWTSGRRHEQTFHLKINRDTTDIQLLKCFKVHRSNNHSVKEDDEDNCLMELPFFCSFGSDEDNIATMSPKNSIQSDMTASNAAGTITSVIVVIAVILVLLFIHRRRLSKKETTRQNAQNDSLQNTVGLHRNNNISQTPVYNEIDRENLCPNNRKFNYPQTVSNFSCDLVNSNKTAKSQNGHYSANHYIQTDMNSIEERNDVGDVEGGKIKEHNVTLDYSDVAIVSEYSLARPITEESDLYGINSDYDHLNNVKKKEDPITKVYDHLPTTVNEDPTYDHSNLKSVSNNDDNYDHFKINGAHA
ncbi:unnamed protein product [Mytilus coruscus]|uniref:WSC domain-containing protein n=1 Tax=Mytilus coruscus TaxID=42192 RepID=A0A6J8EUW2_MYTCO|nr:unnamed protein product [Mytilus coruscus]